MGHLGHIVELYNLACRTSLGLSKDDFSSWENLYKSLMQCRQALTCCVCLKIVDKPIGPDLRTESPKCQHLICLACKGEKTRLKPACGWCSDHKAFVSKPDISSVAVCFKRMCKYICPYIISKNNIYLLLSKQEQRHIRRIIDDGIGVSNDYVKFIISLQESSTPLRKIPLRNQYKSSMRKGYMTKRRGFQYHVQLKRSSSIQRRINTNRIFEKRYKNTHSNELMNLCEKSRGSEINESDTSEIARLRDTSHKYTLNASDKSTINNNNRSAKSRSKKCSKSQNSMREYRSFKEKQSKSQLRALQLQRLRITSIRSSPTIEPYVHTRAHDLEINHSDLDLD